MAEVLPIELAFLCLFCALDPLRVLFKTNVHAALLLLGHANFWIPAGGSLLFAVGTIVCFGGNPVACVSIPVFVLTFVCNLLLASRFCFALRALALAPASSLLLPRHYKLTDRLCILCTIETPKRYATATV